MSEFTTSQLNAAKLHGARVAEETQDADAGVAAFRAALAQQASTVPADEAPANPHVQPGDPSPTQFAKLQEVDRIELEGSRPGVTARVDAAFLYDQRAAERERDPREQTRREREVADAMSDDTLANQLAISRDEFDRRRAAETHADRIQQKIDADESFKNPETS